MLGEARSSFLWASQFAVAGWTLHLLALDGFLVTMAGLRLLGCASSSVEAVDQVLATESGTQGRACTQRLLDP